MITEEEKAKREADAAIIRKADDLESFCGRLLDEGGKRGQISDIRAARWAEASAKVDAIRAEHDRIAAGQISDLMGADYAAADAELRSARDAIDKFENVYLLDEDGAPITCLLTGVPLTDADWYLTDDNGNYVLAEAAGLVAEDEEGDEAEVA